jgi:hypothetical protein
VTAGQTITGVTAGSIKSKCTVFTSAGAGNTAGAATLVDGGTTITLSSQRSITATDAAFVTTNGVDSTGLNLSSSNSITLTVNVHNQNSNVNGSSVTILQDTLSFTITYQPAPTPNNQMDWPLPGSRYWDKFYSFFKDIPIVPQYKPGGIEWNYPPRVTWYQDWNKGPRPTAVVQNPFHQTDWPTALRPPWYRSTEQNLLELPFFKPIPFLQKDWPNPQRVVWYKEASTTLLPELYYYTVPQFQKDWPTPLRVNWYRSTEQNLLETPFFKPIPYQEDNWPVPQRVIWYRDWSQGSQPQPTIVAAPFNQLDWPNPNRVNWDRFWNQTFDIRTLGNNPFSQKDWPLPTRREWDRFWNQTFDIQTLGTKPFRQQDWPLPALQSARYWDKFFSQSPYVPVIIPFHQVDWPLANRPREFREWIQNLLQTTLTPVVVAGAPFSQTDWKLPTPQYWFRDQNQNLVLLFGPTPTPPTDELHFKPIHITMGRLGNLGGLS